MNPERVIPGQVVPAESDDPGRARPQETFLHKVASGRFGTSGADGTSADDDTEVITVANPAGPGAEDTDAARSGKTGSGTADADTTVVSATAADGADVADAADVTDTADAAEADDAGADDAGAGDGGSADDRAGAAEAADATQDDATQDGAGRESADVAETRADTPAVHVMPDSGDPLLGEATGRIKEEWRQVQAAFVDDPRASVAAAAGVVADTAARLESLLRERQRSLRGTWEGNGQADTEALRQLMLGYRRLLTKLLS